MIDPGHNGGNGAASSTINKRVYIGNGMKECDTTGTETNGGYPEHLYNWLVAQQAKAALELRGATVILTRANDSGVGPCINERAAIGNQAHADAVVSIHADGGPASGRGFHIIVPKSIGSNAAIVAPSTKLGQDIHAAYLAETGEPVANYLGQNGYTYRSDMGGLNLSTVPKVFIETGNMRNATDAARLTSASFQASAGKAIADGIATFLQARSS